MKRGRLLQPFQTHSSHTELNIFFAKSSHALGHRTSRHSSRHRHSTLCCCSGHHAWHPWHPWHARHSWHPWHSSWCSGHSRHSRHSWCTRHSWHSHLGTSSWHSRRHAWHLCLARWCAWRCTRCSRRSRCSGCSRCSWYLHSWKGGHGSQTWHRWHPGQSWHTWQLGGCHSWHSGQTGQLGQLRQCWHTRDRCWLGSWCSSTCGSWRAHGGLALGGCRRTGVGLLLSWWGLGALGHHGVIAAELAAGAFSLAQDQGHTILKVVEGKGKSFLEVSCWFQVQLHAVGRDGSHSHGHQLGLHRGTGLRQGQLHGDAAHAQLTLDH
mmetsp:Transcript_69962/g.85835  ORF Transcript_69962/g.85835 Transcript_69962/m.85835 type:complete len:322 (-) Transcript_69962:536-1501(-)